MTTTSPAARLTRRGLEPIVEELVRRLGDGPDPPRRLTLRDLTDDQRAAIADLMGDARLPPGTTRLAVARLCAVLSLADGRELRTTVEELRGPIADRRESRQIARGERESLWGWLTEQVEDLEIAGVGALRGWADVVRRDGARGGIARHRRRLEDALDVLRALPADGVPLAAFADDLLADPHALDRGRSVSRLVLGAIAFAQSRDGPSDAESTRLMWEAVGVAPDPLSSTVLALGLVCLPAHPLEPMLVTSRDSDEPVVLTLSQLRRWPLPPLAPTARLYVVENPSIIAAAANRAWSGPPIVCSSGRPTVAVVTLLRQLGARGATLHQHADFDAAGLAISGWLAERAGTVPWRMSAADYTAAVEVARRRLPLRGTLPPTDWDRALGDAMRGAGLVVYEEELRATLLDAMLDPS